MRIAAVQMQSVNGEIELNLARIEAAAANAVGDGAQLLVAPELAVPGYGAGPFTHLALSRDEMTERLGAVSRRHNIAIAAGFAERSGNAIYNSALLTDGASVNAFYRKSHLYGDYERMVFAAELPSTVVVEAWGLKVGLLICYDVEFPENVRRLAHAGANLVLVPTALPMSDASFFIARQMIQVRAFENHLFVAYADNHGFDGTFAYAGHSLIAAPDGSLLAHAPAEGETLLVADIRPADFQQSVRENDYLSRLQS
jgi:predicted amidohydrolase